MCEIYTVDLVRYINQLIKWKGISMSKYTEKDIDTFCKIQLEGFIEGALDYGIHYTDFDNENMRDKWKKIENKWEEIEKIKCDIEKEMEEAVGII